MRILLTGATGYIGSRLIPKLLEAGHEVVGVVRSKNVEIPGVEIVQADLTKEEDFRKLPSKIDAAFYFVHALKQKGFEKSDAKSAHYFVDYLNRSNAQQVIYLSGLISDQNLSSHLRSRLEVENILKEAKCAHTVLRAGIVIGDGSASFEIMRDLVEKLPIMVAPKWVKNLCQPIAVQDVLCYLVRSVGNKDCFDRVFDVGGPEQLTYKQMLLKLAKVRKLKRWIVTVPVLTPRLSSLWLYLVTSTHFKIARNLVDSLKNNAICQENEITKVIDNKCLSYEKALESFFASSTQLPVFGCFFDCQSTPFRSDPHKVFEQALSLGGKNGYSYNWLWKIRGWIDRLFGGVGLREGKKQEMKEGGIIDFWRVQTLDKKRMRLVLQAEMKLPGEAWLEIKVKDQQLITRAIFRPKGVLGRLYWIAVYPFHKLIFSGMNHRFIRRAK